AYCKYLLTAGSDSRSLEGVDVMSRHVEAIDAETSDTSRKRPVPRAQGVIALSLAIVASVFAFFLAWPWWWDFSYWAESRIMWVIYFATGFVLAIYVFYAFFGSLRTLFEHDAIERAELVEQAEPDDTEGQS
ncbi:hypothetical protein VQ044_24035, partial [Aurantimonas sp. C2-5-R2]